MLIDCVECGNKISDKSSNCTKCGCPTTASLEALNKKCEECGQSTLNDSNLCINPNCRTNAETNLTCGECGSVNSNENAVCSECGCPLSNALSSNDKSNSLDEDDIFCSDCGEELFDSTERVCSKCFKSIPIQVLHKLKKREETEEKSQYAEMFESKATGHLAYLFEKSLPNGRYMSSAEESYNFRGWIIAAFLAHLLLYTITTTNLFILPITLASFIFNAVISMMLAPFYAIACLYRGTFRQIFLMFFASYSSIILYITLGTTFIHDKVEKSLKLAQFSHRSTDYHLDWLFTVHFYTTSIPFLLIGFVALYVWVSNKYENFQDGIK